jgi:membrane-bound lytic murein transglycosylase D
MSGTLWKAGALIGLTLIPLSSYAYRERPFEWSSESDTDLSAVFDAHDESEANLFSPLVPEDNVLAALDDRDHRINPLFQIPPDIRSSVALWLRVYTQLTTQHVVLFDEKHPEIIYETLDFRALAEKSRNRMVYEIVRQRQIKSKFAKYRAAFARLAAHPRPHSPTFEERRVLSALRNASHRHGFASLAHTLRAQTGQRDNIVKGLGKADPLFNKMEAIFASIGIPPELSRLVLVESSFNTSVVSRVGATGVWQFMEPSAREFLIVDPGLKVDERLSPIKSTVAAARLLQRNHRLLRDWGMAITAYNSGPRPLLRASRSLPKRLVARHVFNYCSGARTLGFAGKSYYPSFLAILHAESYRDLFYGRPNQARNARIAYVPLARAQSALSFGLEQGVSLREFLQVNPDVRDINRVLPTGYWLAVPSRDTDSFDGLISQIFSSHKLERRRRLARKTKPLTV